MQYPSLKPLDLFYSVPLGVTPPTVGEPPSKASPVVSGQPLYKRSFSAKIGGDKILDETNFRDNKTLPSNKDSSLDERNVAAKYEGNDQARSNVTEPGTNTFPGKYEQNDNVHLKANLHSYNKLAVNCGK